MKVYGVTRTHRALPRRARAQELPLFPSGALAPQIEPNRVTKKNADLATAKRLDRVAGATPRAQKSMSVRSLKSSTKAYIISKDMPALAMRCVMEASNEAMNVAQTHAPRPETLIGPGPDRPPLSQARRRFMYALKLRR